LPQVQEILQAFTFSILLKNLTPILKLQIMFHSLILKKLQTADLNILHWVTHLKLSNFMSWNNRKLNKWIFPHYAFCMIHFLTCGSLRPVTSVLGRSCLVLLAFPEIQYHLVWTQLHLYSLPSWSCVEISWISLFISYSKSRT
jgi:hypothetical protein